MPQRVTRYSSTYQWSLPQGTPTEITPLTTTILTGSGWIDIDFSMTVLNMAQGIQSSYFETYIDNALIGPEDGGQREISSTQYCKVPVHMLVTKRLGAGEHTIKIFASSSVTDTTDAAQTRRLVITELGF